MTGPSPAREAPVSARMRALDGSVELAVAEAAAMARTRPEAVTTVLAAAFETIGGKAVTPTSVRALPSATREWLLQCSASAFCPHLHWFEARCTHCGEPYDLALDLSHPIYTAPDRGEAEVTVSTSLGARRFAIPCGRHEEAYSELPPTQDVRRAFAGLCGLSREASAEAQQFDAHDLDLIDQALEAASPEIADVASTDCPSCGERTTCRIDPLRFAFTDEDEILGDVHLIAGAYGWGPEEILGLPARRRVRCADLVARDRRSGPSGRRR